MHIYLAEIEKAIDQIFQALDFYNRLLEDLNPPVFSANISETQNIDTLTDQWLEINSEEIKHSEPTLHAPLFPCILLTRHFLSHNSQDFMIFSVNLIFKSSKECFGSLVFLIFVIDTSYRLSYL